jgi:hypothetical protein
MEPALAAEPIENAEAMEPTEPTDKIDPAEPMDRMEPAEPIDRIDPVEPMLRMDPADPGACAGPEVLCIGSSSHHRWTCQLPRCTSSTRATSRSTNSPTASQT